MGGPAVLPLTMLAAVLMGGTIGTYAYDRRAPLLWRLAVGCCTGLAAFGLIGLILASAFGLTPAIAALTAAVTLSPVGLLLRGSYRQALRHDLRSARETVVHSAWPVRGAAVVRGMVYAAGLLLLWRVAARVIMVRPDGIHTGVSHNLGDLPFHLSLVNRLLAGSAIPPEHPSFAGAGFTYPYLTDLVAALFVSAGASVEHVFVWSTWLLVVALAALVYRWTLTITGSRDAACLAPILILLSGGLGWWLFLTEVWNQGGGLSSTLRLTHDYTITADNTFRWGNAVTTLLVPQRGLLLGLPLAVIVFQQWWQASAQDRVVRLAAAGAVAGLLPLVHAHTYAVVLGVGACQALLARDRRSWTAFFVVALTLGLPQVWSVTRVSDVHAQSMMAWSLGWDHGRQPIVLFWLKNTGLLIPLILIALVWRDRPAPVSNRLVRFYLPFLLCFIIPNVFRLAPWVWDNVKVLIYWFVASVPVVSLLLVQLARGAWWRRLAVGAVVASLTLAGALDLWRVASRGVDLRILDAGAVAFAARVSAATEPQALVLHAPTYAHPIVLTGRQSFMGYPGHIWSHGLDPGPRGADVETIYAGTDQSESLLARYHIDYVVVGPLERRQMTVNETFFARFAPVAESPGYTLYHVSHD